MSLHFGTPLSFSFNHIKCIMLTFETDLKDTKLLLMDTAKLDKQSHFEMYFKYFTHGANEFFVINHSFIQILPIGLFPRHSSIIPISIVVLSINWT